MSLLESVYRLQIHAGQLFFQWDYEIKNLTRKRGGGVTDGLTWGCCGKQHPYEILKHFEKDRQKESEDGGRQKVGATRENQQYEIKHLAVTRHSAAATLAVFI